MEWIGENRGRFDPLVAGDDGRDPPLLVLLEIAALGVRR